MSEVKLQELREKNIISEEEYQRRINQKANDDIDDPKSVPATEEAEFPKLIGIDFGTQKFVIAEITFEESSSSVVRNDISDRHTTNLIAFNGKQRIVGENAKSKQLLNPSFAVASVNRLLGKSYADVQNTNLQNIVEHDNGLGVKVTYGDSPAVFRPEQVAAMILKQCQKYVNVSEDKTNKVVLTYPWGSTPQYIEALRNAANIAEFDVLQLIPEHLAITCLYGTKYPIPEGGSSKNVVFVDMGYCHLTLSLSQFETGKGTILAAQNEEVGGFHFDNKLFEYLSEELKNKHQFDAKNNVRYIERLRQLAEKIKNALSTIKETEQTFATPDKDVKFNIKLTQFEQLCETEIARVVSTVDKFLKSLPIEKSAINEVVVIGGGTRIPIVQKTLEDAFGLSLAKNLDSTLSVGLGAAVYGAANRKGYNVKYTIEDKLTFNNPSTEKGMSQSEIEKYKKIEEEMQEQDRLVEKLAKVKNDIESFVFSHKASLSDTKFNNCFDETTKKNLAAKLDEYNTWIDDNYECDLETYENKFQEMKQTTKEIAPKLFQQLEEIEKEKAKVTAEAAANQAPTSQSKNTKPRTNKQKLEAAAKKKEHGNSLFVDLDYVNAIRRYTQALELITSMFDESPEQKEEATKLKLTCHVNLATCLIKVKSYPKAIENCKAALEIDKNHVKALYKRAQASFELKEFKSARDDLDAALKLSPTNKEVKALLQKTQAEIKKFEEKEKKMYSAMFQ